jgi:hypothetical protein
MRRRFALVALPVLAASGCFQPASTAPVSDDPSGSQAGHHGSTAGGGSSGRASSTNAASGASTGSSSGTGTSGGSSVGASNGGGSSGGSSSGGGLAGDYTCPAVAVPPVAVSCSSGAIDFSSQLVELIECTTVDGAIVQALDPNGVPYANASAVTSSTNGTFGICLPAGVPFTFELTAATYPTTYLAELDGTQTQNVTQLGLVSDEFFSVVAGLVPGGLDMTRGTVIVKVDTSLACDMAQAGWTVGIELPDGGSLPDGGYELVYISGPGVPQVGLTATQISGGAVFYNIDPSLSDFFVMTYTNPDAGACEPVNASVGYTGRVYVGGNAVSFFPLVLP